MDNDDCTRDKHDRRTGYIKAGVVSYHLPEGSRVLSIEVDNEAPIVGGWVELIVTIEHGPADCAGLSE